MTVNSLTTSSNWLAKATASLKAANIDSARLDAILMLEDCLDVSRTNVLSNPGYELTELELKQLNSSLKRRLKYEPMAYIRNRVEFYGRLFYIDKSVLIPRPESESFIELLAKLDPGYVSRVVDVGCGSGCIGISAKLEMPNLTVDLVDTSPSATKIADKNAKSLKADVGITKGDLLADTGKPYDVVLANLPYIPKAYKFDQSTSYEPKLSLIGGVQGLELYKKLWEQIKNLEQSPSIVITESLKFQHQDMDTIASSSGYHLDKTDGLVQLFRLSVT